MTSGEGKAMTIYSTIWASSFSDRVVQLRRDQHSRIFILRSLLKLRAGDALLLNGALGYADFWIDLFYGLAVRIFRKNVTLVISDATWHARSTRNEARAPALHALIEWWAKTLLRLLKGPNTHFCFLSRSEVANFIADAGVDPQHAHFTPFSATISRRELGELENEIAASAPDEPYVFSGGNASRDYDLLCRAVRDTNLKVRIATTLKRDWPPQVVAGAVSHWDFLKLMAKSSAVAVILDSTTRRSGGQQTYLNAMLLRRPIIVNDVVGVRDYLVHRETAIIVPPRDPQALRDALQWIADPTNRQDVEGMVARARSVAERHSFEGYFARLEELVAAVGGKCDALAEA